ncbi:MAG: glycosyltransferase family 4 protein [Phycisphaerales bacterium]|jgi:glycosyltransferase involved in cell wall biosynthesis|nr:glycosyltransferase family 4 protein [Phycisphaerales bacterium]
MKITFVLEAASLAGGVRVVAIYAKELSRRGHQVCIVSTQRPPYSTRHKVKSLLKGEGWLGYPPLGPTHLDGLDVEQRVLSRHRPVRDKDVPDADVVVATWWKTADWVANLSPKKGAKAYLIQHYETWGGPPGEVDRTWRLPLHKIVISKWLADLARDKFGDEHYSWVPNSVDTEQFHAPQRDKRPVPTVGLMYATIPFKGIDVSLKALELAKRDVGNLQLVAFGKEEPTAELPLPAGSKMVYLPAQDAIADIYRQCDVWLCGSRGEGFHLPPLEAMACRCPVVSTKVGGPMDVIVDDRNGYLVDVEDAQSLADRLVRVLTFSPQRWREMSDAAYATATEYTWSQATDRLEGAFAKAMERRGSRL